MAFWGGSYTVYSKRSLRMERGISMRKEKNMKTSTGVACATAAELPIEPAADVADPRSRYSTSVDQSLKNYICCLIVGTLN